jgi:acetyltransferase-like isoleucine patch superfamily enzyme
VGLNRPCVLSVSRDASIVIGNNCGFSGTVIAAASSIHIGDRVLCGANCTIIDSDCHPLDATARANEEPAKAAPIVIEDDVWLGVNVVVLKGCRIGAKTVVAANTVVTHSLPGNVLAAGVPASVLREGMLISVDA